MNGHFVDAATGRLHVHGEPYLIRGVELHNSTASSPDHLRQLWPRLVEAKVNTVLLPVSWEVVEPSEAEFDFGPVDQVLAGARRHGLKLVLLWFGSWKNGSSSYAPAWVKLDPERFPVQVDGSGSPLDNLSPFSDANRDADADAFAAFMGHLAGADGSEGTVIMVQLENEVGLLGPARSFGADASAAWAAPVPPSLLEAVRDGAFPHVAVPDAVPAAGSAPTWSDLLGGADRTAELFMAWHYAAYVQHVASAGLARHDLPLFVNAWLDSPVPDGTSSTGAAADGAQVPGTFPSGGPLPHVSAAWKLAAPSIAFLAPDVYFGDFETPFKAYRDTNAAFFVPEIRADGDGLSHAFLAIGAYGAIGVSPFGFDSLPENDVLDLCRDYTQLAALEAEILDSQTRGRVRGFRVEGGEEQGFTLGRYGFLIRSHRARSDGRAVGYGLLLQRDEQTYVAAGRNFIVDFTPLEGGPVAVLRADELVVGKGRLTPHRRLNGDETFAGTRILIADNPTLLHGSMVMTGAHSGIVRFSLYSLGRAGKGSG